MGGALRAKGRHARPAADTLATAGVADAADVTDAVSMPTPGRAAMARAAVRRTRTATRGRAAARQARNATTAPAVTARSAVRRTRTMLAGAATTLWPTTRRAKAAVAGAAVLTTALSGSAAAFLTLVPARPGAASRDATVNALGGPPVPVPAAVAPARRPSRSSSRGDQAALAFYEHRDPAHAAHVTEVVWTGPMLRVYTDLPASGADSKTAISLCETAVAYAQDRDRLPAVFVHADKEAGYPVLANKMGANDDCRLGRVP